MPVDKLPGKHCRSILASSLLLASAANALDSKPLQEVIVTAQKREESLQTVPVAVSVLDSKQIQEQSITGIGSMLGAIPSLEGQPWGNTQNTWIISIRGNGPIDAAGITRSGSVGVYIDGVYLARPQALALEMTDLERIEVLRGPQGSLFGRNSTAGAVNFISKKPILGDFHLEQTIGIGNYGIKNITTRANIPITDKISAKLDYVSRKHDGWVNNPKSDENDFGDQNDEGGRVAFRYQPIDDFELGVTLDKSRASSTMLYYQVYQDNGIPSFGILPMFGNERDRKSTSRRPISPLDPTVTKQQGYAIIADWNISAELSAKGIISCRELKENTGGNYGGVLYFNGFIVNANTDQHQCSQELALQGKNDSLNWIAGIYNFGEGAHQDTNYLFSLDQFGIMSGVPFTPITPTNVNPSSGSIMPSKLVKADAESSAVYGQVTWTPPFDNRLHLTVGGRYTKDRLSGDRFEEAYQKFNLNEHSTDGTASIAYDFSENIIVYGKWASAYRSGGVNPGSVTLTPYDPEKVKSIELGLKSEILDHRARINIAAFRTFYNHMQIDVEDPALITLTQTINAQKTVRIEGLEFDGNFSPIDGLVLGLSYTYLRGTMPIQPNTLENDAPTQFRLTQTPRHAGAATIDYTFGRWEFGTVTGHLDITSTDHYAHIPQDTRTDAYTLANARLSLSDIPVGRELGKVRISAWAKNLLDEEYIILAYPNPPIDVVQQFGPPRTYGMDFNYTF